MAILLLFTVPAFLAILSIAFRRRALNRWLVLFHAVVQAALTVWLAVNGGEFTEYLRIDPLNTLFLLVQSAVYLFMAIYNYSYMKQHLSHRMADTFYSLCVMLSVTALNGVILSTHLGVLWVFIEATTLLTAYLIYFNKTRDSLEAAWKYLFICSIGISLAFVGIIFLSIGTGKVNSLFFRDLYAAGPGILSPFWLKASFVFILIGFGTKMGLSPLHAWLPDAHSEAPSPVSAMLSGTLLNAALLGVLRVYKLMLLNGLSAQANAILLTLGVLSLLISAAYILRVKNYKRLLAYSSIENMGIIVIGTAIGGPALLGAMFHVAAHSLSKAGLFLSSGNILNLYQTKNSAEVKGLWKSDPWTGWLFALFFVSLAGMPPFPVFLSEFFILKGMAAKSDFLIMAVFVVLLTVVLFGMGRTVFGMCFGDPEKTNGKKTPLPGVLPLALALGALIYLGIFMQQPVFDLFRHAAEFISQGVNY